MFYSVAFKLIAQNTYVPDDNFELALIDLGYDSGALDDSVLTANIRGIVRLDVSERPIANLQGIEDFSSLEILYCIRTPLTSLDLSKNTALVEARLHQNFLTDLDVKSNINLEWLTCSNSQLEHIDVSTNVNLKTLNLGNNKLTSIDISNNTELENFYIDENLITELDVSNNEKLEWLVCSGNQLNNIDVSFNPFLRMLSIWDNNLTELNIENNTDLTHLWISNNSLTELDISNNKKLESIQCHGNYITHFDLSSQTNLINFLCSDNNLHYLNVKNGNNHNMNDARSGGRMIARGNPNLKCIEVDDPIASESYSRWDKDSWASYSSDCTTTYGIDNQTTCDSYTWIDGNTYASSNNTATFTLTNTEGGDSIVTLDLTILHSTTGVDVQTACNSYSWIDGNTYFESNNTATHTLTNAAGCDSIVTLDLTIDHPTYNVDVQTACDIYTWIDGITYTSSNNTATFTVINEGRCDSIVTLDLTILHSTSREDVQTACESYRWIDGKTYRRSNKTATHTLTNSVGCDSIITLNLTIFDSNNEVDVQTACESFKWIDGNTYTSSNNTATYSYTTTEGCSSTVSLDLTILNSTSSLDIQSACDSFTWIDGKTYYESNNSATYTLTNAEGCDSIVTLNLILNHSTYAVDEQTAIDSFTWIDGITYTSSNNTATHTYTNDKGCDSIITLDLTVNYSTYGTDAQTACDSFTWIDGITYISSNDTATYTLTNAIGYDSIVTLDLTVNHSTIGTDVQTACDSFTWIDGITYKSSNKTATFTLTNAEGCDSIITLDLIVNNSTYGTDIQTACDSLVWIDGITYKSSNNTATYTLTNGAGCDSIITLDLTVNNSTYGTDVQIACDSLVWVDGITYKSSNNTATYTLTNGAGCDSIVTLDLTVNNSTYGTDVQIACDSLVWVDGITYKSSNNTATYTLTNGAGCDSIVTLDLTVNIPTYGIDEHTACDSFTWIDGILYESSSNMETFTLTNAAGCDSIVTLDLTITYSSSSTLAEVACDTYTAPSGIIYSETGIYNDIIQNVMGCDSVITIDLTINSVDTNITIFNNTLTSSANGATLQWIDCSTLLPIYGETNQSITISENGSYALIISEYGCVDTSSCVFIAIDSYFENDYVKIYPNPTNGIVNINFGGLPNPVIRVLTLDGKLVYEQDKIDSNEFQFELDVVSGIYFVEIFSQRVRTVFKLEKK